MSDHAKKTKRRIIVYVATSADGYIARPVLAEIEKDLAAARADFDALMQKEIPAYNKSAAG